jgi:hypothetical protein
LIAPLQILFNQQIKVDASCDEISRNLQMADLSVPPSACPRLRDYLVVYLAGHWIELLNCETLPISEMSSHSEKIRYAITSAPVGDYSLTQSGRIYSQLKMQCDLENQASYQEASCDYIAIELAPIYISKEFRCIDTKGRVIYQ